MRLQMKNQLAVPGNGGRYVQEGPDHQLIRNDNPYRPPDEQSSKDMRRTWKWVRRLAIFGAAIGVAIPLANVVRVFAWMWSRPPAPPGTAYSGTPGVAAIFLALLGCPLLAVLLGTIGGLLGGILDMTSATIAKNENNTNDT